MNMFQEHVLDFLKTRSVSLLSTWVSWQKIAFQYCTWLFFHHWIDQNCVIIHLKEKIALNLNSKMANEQKNHFCDSPKLTSFLDSISTPSKRAMVIWTAVRDGGLTNLVFCKCHAQGPKFVIHVFYSRLKIMERLLWCFVFLVLYSVLYSVLIVFNSA